MATQTIRDRLWLWGMAVNALQQTSEYGAWGFGASTMTVEDAVRRTGITNVIVAGGLPIDARTLAAMPSARRIICKQAAHCTLNGTLALDAAGAASALSAAKRLAEDDGRIEGFHLDDFTVSLDAGLTREHVARFLFENAVAQPRLPMSATIYPQILDRPDLPAFLPYFDMFLTALWHADRIDRFPDDIARLCEMSGGKPILACLYVYDFGGERPLPAALMRRHLEVAEGLLQAGRVMGLCICGTCMMDLDWESNRCLYDWLDRVGDATL